VPEDGTVGIYTLRVSDGGWSQSLNLYVIFQWPDGLSDSFVDNFLYDDDFDNDRDTSSIGYFENDPTDDYEYTHDDPGFDWIPPGEWITHGWLWRFRTQHYDDFVLEDYVMPTINGQRDTWNAANALGHHVDELTCFGYPRPLGNSWCVLNPASCSPYTNENQCTNIANLLTAFNRAAGIPSRPVFSDRIHISFDHSTEVWTKRTSPGSSYGWYVTRGYAGDEGSCPDPHYTGGIIELRSTSGYYAGSGDQGVYVAPENWGNLGGYASSKDQQRLASWDYDMSAKTGQIYKKSTIETRFMAYLDWSSEPTVVGSPPDDWPQVPSSLTAASSGSPQVGADLNGDAVIRFGPVMADYGLDLDGDGLFDQLVFAIDVYVFEAGDYWIRGVLGGDYQVPEGGDLIEAIGHVHLTEGPHTIELPFDGMDIYMTKTDGPYSLVRLWATDIQNPTKSEFAERLLASAKPGYQTGFYRFSDFGRSGARLSGKYNPYSIDTDGDEWVDALVLETALVGVQGEVNTVQGVLYDGQEDVISQASWSGGGSQVRLQFDGLRDTTGPYTLQHLHVRNADGQVTDGITEPYVLGDLAEFSAKPILLGVDSSVIPADSSEIGANFVIIGPYSDSRVDTDGDGQYDQLVITVPVEVETGEGGQAYRIEGWLADKDNNLISWASSASQVLGEGVHNLSLVFDGRIIHEHGVDGPYTLMALKAVQGSTYNVVNSVHIAYTTPAYSHSEFEEPVSPPSGVSVFEDDMESGTGKWASWSSWDLSTSDWFSYSHAWKTSSSGSLTTKTMDLSSYEYPKLTARFRTCYDMQTAGHLEVKADGGSWTEVATIGNTTPHWTTEYVDLSDFRDAETLQLRFRADSQSGLLWAVDDIYVNAQSIQPVYLPIIMK
jgi:hypothetical protein